MTVPEAAQLLGALAAILASGGWAARLGLRAAEQRKLLAEARIAEATAGGMVTTSVFSGWQAIVTGLREEVVRLCKRLEESEEREKELERQLRQALKDIATLKAAQAEPARPRRQV